MADTTVAKLIELLKDFNQDSLIVNEQNEPFVHISNLSNGSTVLSTVKPIGECNRCGGKVFPSQVGDYVGVCTEHDEDLYEFEFTRK